MNPAENDIVPTLRMFDGVMMGKAADEIERLRSALEKYGKHLERCDSRPRHAHDQRLFSEMICDCGFAEAISKSSK